MAFMGISSTVTAAGQRRICTSFPSAVSSSDFQSRRILAQSRRTRQGLNARFSRVDSRIGLQGLVIADLRARSAELRRTTEAAPAETEDERRR